MVEAYQSIGIVRLIGAISLEGQEHPLALPHYDDALHAAVASGPFHGQNYGPVVPT